METTINNSRVITPVVRDKDFSDMRELCIEHATSIDFEMDYQQLLRESASMKEIYRMPKGVGFYLENVYFSFLNFFNLFISSFNLSE